MSDYIEATDEDIVVDPEVEMTDEDIREVITGTGSAIRQDEDEIATLTTVATALESIRTNLHANYTLTDDERALLRVTSESIGSAFNVPAGSVNVGLESVSEESITGILSLGAIIVAVWKTIKAIVKNIWEKIQAFFSSAGRVGRNTEKAFTAILKKITTLDPNSRDLGALTIRSEGRYLRVADKPFGLYEDILGGVQDLKTSAQVLLKQYADQLPKVGMAVYEGIRDFDLNDPEQSLNEIGRNIARVSTDKFSNVTSQIALYDATPAGVVVNQLTMSVGRSARVNGLVVQSPALIGLQRFSLKEYRAESKVKGSPSSMDLAQALQGQLVQFLPDSVIPERAPMSYTLPNVLTLTEISQLCSEGLALCNEINEFYESGKVQRLEQIRKNIEKETEALNARSADVEGLSSDAVECYRLALSYNSTYASWVHNPITDFVAHSLNVAQAVILVCVASMKMHTAK